VGESSSRVQQGDLAILNYACAVLNRALDASGVRLSEDALRERTQHAQTKNY
jgi:hypothetical protein